MPKTLKYFVLDENVPEWGVSRKLSVAVPIAPSGVEFKSTKDASKAMDIVLRSKVNKETVAELRKFLKQQKRTLGKPKQGDFKTGLSGYKVSFSKSFTGGSKAFASARKVR
jgi:hypothetical protein